MIYVYPPIGITVLNAWEIPLLNTVILLSSGATITWCHHAIVVGSREDTLFGFTATIILAIIFTSLQIFEYFGAPFTISDSVYGSTFFMATGFHGFHVFVGTCFLTVCFFRNYFHQFTQEQHLGAEFAIWYWHFVDATCYICNLSFIYSKKSKTLFLNCVIQK